MRAPVRASRASAGLLAAEFARPRIGRAGLSWLWPESGAISPIPAVDGLRGLAILLVVMFHAWYKAPGAIIAPGANFEDYPLWQAHTGVLLFFVLSGFLLFLPYASWMFNLRNRPSAAKFYRRRILRVGPAFWFSLAVLVALGPLTLSRLSDAGLHAIYVFNFVPGLTQRFNDVYWTMAVEVQFYATLPLIALALRHLAQRIGIATATSVILVAAGAVSAASIWLEHSFSPLGPVMVGLVGQHSLSFYLIVFAAGILCSIVFVYFQDVARLDAAAARRLRRGATLLLVGGVIFALVLTLVTAGGAMPLGSRIYGLPFGAAYAALLLGVLLGAPRLTWLFARPEIRFIGLISYSLYLWHTVVLAYAGPLLINIQVPWQRVLGALAVELLVAVPIAYLAYQLIERPFIKQRQTAH